MASEAIDQAGRLARVEVMVSQLDGDTKQMHADMAAIKELLSQLKGAMRMLIGVLWVLTIMFAGALGAGKWQGLLAWLAK